MHTFNMCAAISATIHSFGHCSRENRATQTTLPLAWFYLVIRFTHTYTYTPLIHACGNIPSYLDNYNGCIQQIEIFMQTHTLTHIQTNLPWVVRLQRVTRLQWSRFLVPPLLPPAFTCALASICGKYLHSKPASLDVWWRMCVIVPFMYVYNVYICLVLLLLLLLSLFTFFYSHV